MNDVDAILRADGEQWRQEAEAAGSLIQQSPRRRNSTRWLVPAAAAIVVVGVAVTSIVLTRSSPDPKGVHAVAPNPTTATVTPLPGPSLTGSADPFVVPSRFPTGGFEPLPELTATEAKDMTDTPWQFANLSADGTVLTIRWGVGSCAKYGFTVIESEDAVQVRVLTSAVTPPAGIICTAVLHLYASQITLNHPLAGRQLLHG